MKSGRPYLSAISPQISPTGKNTNIQLPPKPISNGLLQLRRKYHCIADCTERSKRDRVVLSKVLSKSWLPSSPWFKFGREAILVYLFSYNLQVLAFSRHLSSRQFNLTSHLAYFIFILSSRQVI